MLALKGLSFILSPELNKDSKKKSELYQLVLENGGSISNSTKSIVVVSGLLLYSVPDVVLILQAVATKYSPNTLLANPLT